MMLSEKGSGTFVSKSGRSFIGLVRWVSALVVFLAHLRAAVFLGWADLPAAARTLPTHVLYALTSYFHEAVIVFFVLSGFLVGGLNLERSRKGAFDVKFYAIDRATRIYVTLVPSLALTLIAFQLGAHLTSWTGFYDQSNALFAERFSTVRPGNGTIGVLTGNLAMLQPVYVPPLGANVPLWSLSYEVWFYVWFGLVAVAIQSPNIRNYLIVISATILLGLYFQWIAIYYLLIWMSGVLAASWRGWPRSLWIPIAIIAASLALATSKQLMVQLASITVRGSDLVLALGMAWMVASMRDRHVVFLERMDRFNQWASNFSFSLYVVHFPLMLLVLAGITTMMGVRGSLKSGLLPFQISSIVIYVATVLIVLLLAYLFSFAFERRTTVVRSWLKNQLAVR